MNEWYIYFKYIIHSLIRGSTSDILLQVSKT